MGSAQAGVLTFQDVVFTTSWTDNVLTLEIDAAKHGGNWSGATMLGAIGIKEIGRFDSVSLVSAPGGNRAWTLNSRELDAKGCGDKGGKASNAATKVLCLSGGPALLADDMIFSFAFTGAPTFDEPHLKVNFLDSSRKQVGDLMSLNVTAPLVVVPPQGTPVTPQVLPQPVMPPVDEATAPSDIPEPRTIALLLGGLALMGLVLRKRS